MALSQAFDSSLLIDPCHSQALLNVYLEGSELNRVPSPVTPNARVQRSTGPVCEASMCRDTISQVTRASDVQDFNPPIG